MFIRLRGRLREVVAFERRGRNFSSLACDDCRDLPRAPFLIQTNIIMFFSATKLVTSNFKIKTVNGSPLIILHSERISLIIVCRLT